MTRTYESPSRDAQREQTRRKIVRVASQMFAEQGYIATTIRGIAQRAGVSLERVSATGGKAALLLAAVEEAINDGEPLGLIHRSDIAPAWAGDELDEILAALVDFVVASDQRLDSLMNAWSEARRAEPQLAAAYVARMDSMRATGRDFVTQLIERGLVAPNADPGTIADEFWAMSHPSQYDLLVNCAGWSGERYREWLLVRTRGLFPRGDGDRGAPVDHRLSPASTSGPSH